MAIVFSRTTIRFLLWSHRETPSRGGPGTPWQCARCTEGTLTHCYHRVAVVVPETQARELSERQRTGRPSPDVFSEGAGSSGGAEPVASKLFFHSDSRSPKSQPDTNPHRHISQGVARYIHTNHLRCRSSLIGLLNYSVYSNGREPSRPIAVRPPWLEHHSRARALSLTAIRTVTSIRSRCSFEIHDLAAVADEIRVRQGLGQ